MKNIFKCLLSIRIFMLALFYVMFFLFSYSNVEVNTEVDILFEDDTFGVNKNANVIIDLIPTNISIPEDAWLLLYTQEILTSTTVSQNTIDFDQTEYGGTVNFLLIPE